MPTPLTDADKVLRNDVGKRMAVALEAIAEGSGGSAKIEEMTQAEYDALTPAQKADGTLRAISDGQTKIQDIDNVTITTSDNNKLLGVSVSGSDISVGAVAPTLVTQTSYSGITDNTEIYKITDKIYIISINITNSTATSAWVNICDFSAPSFSNQCFTAVSTETNDSTYCQCFYTNGNARLRISAPKASTYRGFMMLVIP